MYTEYDYTNSLRPFVPTRCLPTTLLKAFLVAIYRLKMYDYTGVAQTLKTARIQFLRCWLVEGFTGSSMNTVAKVCVGSALHHGADRRISPRCYSISSAAARCRRSPTVLILAITTSSTHCVTATGSTVFDPGATASTRGGSATSGNAWWQRHWQQRRPPVNGLSAGQGHTIQWTYIGNEASDLNQFKISNTGALSTATPWFLSRATSQQQRCGGSTRPDTGHGPDRCC